jgi:hypothetical protein
MTPYSFFGDVVCINLDHRKDRRDYSESVFKKHNIPARFMTVSKHPKGGVYGCFDSHIKIVLEAYRQGRDNVLVFEDDLLPTDSYNINNLMNAISFMRNEKDWDIFYFGYMVFNFDINYLFLNAQKVPNYNHIVQYNPFATHAMVYSKRAIEKIVRTYPKYLGKEHYDIYLSHGLHLKNFCYTPMLFDQKFCFASDIESRNLLEATAKNIQCFSERNQLFHKVSFFKHIIDSNIVYIYIVIVLILIVCLIYICCVYNIKTR